MREWTFDIEQVMKSLHHLQRFPKPEDFKYKDYKGNVLVLRGDPKKTFYVQDSDIKGFVILYFFYHFMLYYQKLVKVYFVIQRFDHFLQILKFSILKTPVRIYEFNIIA